ncbi:MAG: hypothetical protein WCG25_07235 [bacterium]
MNILFSFLISLNHLRKSTNQKNVVSLQDSCNVLLSKLCIQKLYLSLGNDLYVVFNSVIISYISSFG